MDSHSAPYSAPQCLQSGDDFYAYLLGVYLGDGYLVVGPRGVAHLRIACDRAWPGVASEITATIKQVMPRNVVGRQIRGGCVIVSAYSKHWPCLFPQHGAGRKHQRAIVLQPWQRSIVDKHAQAFLRGLFHSDGCRSDNRITKITRAGPKTYVYPRYFFSNESDDILQLCETSLDHEGIDHRRNRPNSISVARRNAVAALDAFVGPKY